MVSPETGGVHRDCCRHTGRRYWVLFSAWCFGLRFSLFQGFGCPISPADRDVYEGAPTPITAFFAAAPRLPNCDVRARHHLGFPRHYRPVAADPVFVAIASMALGSFAAIGQHNIKRLMAYSSIGHMGFALIGLAAGTEEGVRGIIIYMAIYLAMTLGSFWMHPRHARRQRSWPFGGDRRSCRARSYQAGNGLVFCPPAVLAGRDTATGWVLCKVSTCFWPPSKLDFMGWR